jgi:SAM-dependent methyltransferase
MSTLIQPVSPSRSAGKTSGARLVSRNACPWCGAANPKIVAEYPYRREPLLKRFQDVLGESAEWEDFVVCACSCGVMFQRDILDPASHTALYDSWRYSHSSMDFILFYLQELLMVRSWFRRPASELTLLDYGMGWGKFCDVARSMDFRAIGLEINREMRDFARARGTRVVSSLEEVEPGTLDFINLEQVLEHVAAPARLVEDLTIRLRPGGLLKISVPHRSRGLVKRLARLEDIPPARLYADLMEIWPLAHINSFSRRSLMSGVPDMLRRERVGLGAIVMPLSLRSGWREALRIVGRPLYKNYHPRSNYLFFKKIR